MKSSASESNPLYKAVPEVKLLAKPGEKNG